MLNYLRKIITRESKTLDGVSPRPHEEGLITRPESSSDNPHEAVPDTLLATAKSDITSGNWQRLIDIPLETVRQHSERATLSMLIGMAHLQLGNMGRASEQFSQACDWGADRQQVARILLSAAYSTVGTAYNIAGRAKASENTARLAKLLVTGEKASSAARPSLSSAFVGAGARKQDATLPPKEGSAPPMSPSIDCDKGVSDAVIAAVGDKITQSAKQTQSMLGLHHLLLTGNILSVSSESQEWPVSADFSLEIALILHARRHDLIVEFGSGYSTTLICQCLEKFYPTEMRPSFVSFEHSKYYWEKSQQRLAQAGVQDLVALVHAPLVNFSAESGECYKFYDVAPGIATVRKELAGSPQRILAIVDGPPGSTCPLARFPALPALVAAFPNTAIEVLLDDYARADEQEVVKRWQRLPELSPYNFDVSPLPLQRGACKLTLSPKPKK